MTVHYFAIEPGVHMLPDGATIEAGSIDTATLQHGTHPGNAAFNALPEGWETVNFTTAFGTAPSVLAQVQTMNNETGSPPAAPSVPWLTAAVRNASSSSVELALERSESDNGSVAGAETVAYVAIGAGIQGSFADSNGATVLYETLLTGQDIGGWSNGCDNTNFQNSYAASPLVMATKVTHIEDDGGWLRRCSLNKNFVGLTVDEDIDGDGERNHVNEAAGLLVFSRGFDFDSSVPPPGPSTDFRIEADVVSLPAVPAGSTSFTSVTFRQQYSVTPLVFAITSNGDPLPTALRVRNISTTGFEIAQVGPPGNASPPQAMTIHYVAVEPGVHQFPDGTDLEAGTLSTQTVQYGGNNPDLGGPEGWDSLVFSAPFTSPPALLAQIQGLVNETGSPPGAASVPWLGVAMDNVSSTSAQIALERSEVDDGSVNQPETIAYLAIAGGSVGSFTDNGGNTIGYESIVSADFIRGWSNGCYTVNFSTSYSSPVVVAKKDSHDGGDGGWLRRCSLGAASVGLTVDEDIDNDGERWHTTELAGIAVFSQPFDADFSGIQACGLIPGDFPIYGDSEVDIKNNVTMNGNAVASGKTGNSVDINGVRSDISQTLPELDPNSFPPNNSFVDATEADSPFVATTAVFYDEITINDNQSASFSGGGPFHIDTLTIGANSVVDLAAGTYYVNDLDMRDDGAALNVASEAVVLHIGNKADLAGRDLSVNNGGSVTGLRVFVHKDAEFKNGDRRLDFTGLIYGPEAKQVEFDRDATVRAAVITLGKVKVDRDAAWTYTASDQAAVNNVTTCAAVTLSHFVVTHDGFGINCLNETITVSAIGSDGQPYTDPLTATLDTQTGKGSWVATSGSGTLADPTGNDGLAEYTFDTADGGTVDFDLEYREGAASIDIDVYDSADPSVRDDDSEGNIDFSPNGLTVTSGPLGNPPPSAIPAFAPQTAGTAFPVYLTAYGQIPADPVCGVIETYEGAKGLQFWSGYLNPGTGTRQVSVTDDVDTQFIGTSEAGATARTVAFTQGQAQVIAKYKDVGRISINMKDTSVADPNLPNGIRGGAQLVVKPADFVLSSIVRPDDATPADCVNGVTPNPGAGGPGGGVFQRAGRPFCATVTAVDAEGDTTPNFGNEGEGVLLTANLSPACTGCSNNPSLQVETALSFSSGVATGRYSWGEVGIITLTPSVEDGDYLGAGDVTGTTSGNVGRFIPAELAVAVNTPQLGTGCGTFGYQDQPLKYTTQPVISVTARNDAGGTTANYTGPWWKITNGSLTPGTQGARYTAAAGTLDVGALPDVSTDPVINDAGNGTGTLTFSMGATGIAFSRGAPSAPFAADIALSLNVLDDDGAAYPSNPVRFGDATPGNGIAFSNGKEIRYGRLVLENAFGSELLDLDMPLRAEYYAGAASGFVLNTADNCTAVVAGDVGFSNRKGNLSADPAVGATSFSAGRGAVTLGAPGSGNDGSVDVTIDLGGAAQRWLRYDWLTDGNQDGVPDDDPQATATFGIYRGDEQFIYFRELY